MRKRERGRDKNELALMTEIEMPAEIRWKST